MGTYKLKGDQGVQILRKSRKLVGLRWQEEKPKPDQKEYISEEIRDFLGGFRLVSLDTAEKELDEKLDEVRQRDDIALGTHVFFAEGSTKPLVPTGEINITFENGTSEEEQAIVLDEFALELVERRSPEFIIVHVTEHSPNPVKAAAAMQASSLVHLAEPDFDTILDRYDVPPADPLLAHQWSLRNQGRLPDANVSLRFGADAKIVDAWSRLGNLGDSGVKLALIDDGFDLTHPDLKNKITDPFDFRQNSTRIAQGNPNYTHGTPCATVALADSNHSGMVGAAPRARFVPMEGTSFSDRITEAQFDYCIRKGVDIISCSWGTTDPANRLNYRKQQAIAKAAKQGRNGKGCVVLFAAGNEGYQFLNYYAAHPDVISVGACTSHDKHAPYSNQGPQLTVVAPSSGDWPILAGRAWWDQGDTRQAGQYKYWIDGVSRGRHYKHFGGTSSATPLVAGICALILSANPDLTAGEVKDILIQTADKIGNSWEYSNGHSRKFGYGRVNAARAVEEARQRRVSNQPTPSTGSSSQDGGGSGSSGLFEVSVNDSVKMGWGVQIGAYTNYDSVMVLVSQLERTYQQPVHVQSVPSGSRTVYRVVVGSYPTADEARGLQSKLQRAGYSGAFIKNLRE